MFHPFTGNAATTDTEQNNPCTTLWPSGSALHETRAATDRSPTPENAKDRVACWTYQLPIGSTIRYHVHWPTFVSWPCDSPRRDRGAPFPTPFPRRWRNAVEISRRKPPPAYERNPGKTSTPTRRTTQGECKAHTKQSDNNAVASRPNVPVTSFQVLGHKYNRETTLDICYFGYSMR